MRLVIDIDGLVGDRRSLQTLSSFPSFQMIRLIFCLLPWGIGAAGSASALQAEGRRFEPGMLHDVVQVPYFLFVIEMDRHGLFFTFSRLWQSNAFLAQMARAAAL